MLPLKNITKKINISLIVPFPFCITIEMCRNIRKNFYNFAGFSQEKITSEFVRYSQFCPNLASMMVKEVLPSYDGWLIPVLSTASSRAFKVYESNFEIPNLNIFEYDLWFLYISRSHIIWTYLFVVGEFVVVSHR